MPEFGYTFQRRKIDWPKVERIPDSQDLKINVEQLLPYVSLKSETARREILIAPILFKIVQYTQSQMWIEYAIQVNDKLKGTLDYYLYTEQSLLAVEAEKADLTQGLTQLSVEMIALDQWLNSDQNILVGSITSGELWQLNGSTYPGYLLEPRTYSYPDEGINFCLSE
ncbi:hypothetical protein L1047_16460 [Synechococcus sp. Nb3U1]|uniref:hypothetical protein n=1 Tax=Synechococcus sp. Nb3U1 TaxID=1914529 RepID=UPI001F24BA0D|nr:hypothetical protein [Synechococcus sp. Nb3U1]MCF2972787.1 hypothetical protein [Synechococcus sp. Nb3U1]